MKKRVLYFFLLIFCLCLTSVAAHKYYVGVFQMEHVPAKKVIRMTARIFIDDFEVAIDKKYKQKFYFGSSRELPEAADFLQKYFAENINVKINGRIKAIKYLGKEVEDDILVCYYTIPAEGKVQTVEVRNTILFESFPDQQNYIHAKINSNKKSLLLTNDEQQGTLEF